VTPRTDRQSEDPNRRSESTYLSHAAPAEADPSADALDETGFRSTARFLVMSFGGEAIYLATAHLLI
ncbi:MAG: hypothetical protein WBC39_05810, partial [Phycisphaerae bacterium]